MQKLYFFLIIFTFGCIQNIEAQKPLKPNSINIYHQIQKLNFLGSVLYIAAHPDDENTRLITFLANEKKARTGYLSLTRGDGGQNLIGPELRELLGTIRTQELIEARKIDGGEQFFTRANDFGFSKTPTETLNIWNKDAVLSDVIYNIRKFQPDVIINRFDARTPGTTHGHHTASAMLSLEAFDKTNKNDIYPEQLNLVSTWQPKRVYFNTSWWFYGSKEKFEKADKSKLSALNIGVYYPSVGKSNQEIAALSRSQHQSQGFGSTGTRGDEIEYLELLKGDMPQNPNDLFEGIDTTWNRIKGGKTIGDLLTQVEKNFDFKNPSASVPDLIKAYSMIQLLDDHHWKEIKSEEIKNIIAACTGLYLEAVTSVNDATPGSKIKIKLEAINRSNLNINWPSFTLLPTTNIDAQTLLRPVQSETFTLKNNKDITEEVDFIIPEKITYTQPYWLENEGNVGMYRVDDQKKIGLPDVIREVKVIFNLDFSGVSIPFERTAVYKYNDDVKGEVYQPFDIVPEISTTITNKVLLFNKHRAQEIEVKVKAGREKVNGQLMLQLPPEWKITPTNFNFDLDQKGAEQTFIFEVTPPKNPIEITAQVIALVNNKPFNQERINISYPHIAQQQVLKNSQARLIKLDIKTGDEKIAYIMGAGDEVPKYLKQMGYEVSIVNPEDITAEKLASFDVVMTGIRAYNTIQALALKQSILLDFVKQGHTMIVQYNTLDDLVTPNMSPYPLKISRDRVTEENAEVTFLDPENPILNKPNKITTKDFTGWKQEQGLYYPNQWDTTFKSIISAHDQGETPKNGAILVAPVGKGHYIYTGLSFFRELPEGVSGAYRLLANMISLK
ncbi:PIG-L family deacetylase [Flavobacterium sp. CYK-55]|uniref:PIG-L family deacetylase n=1 Tax=Flavobacterium sp. CYK-55 TaxID=2835529 RepID=UPI001BCEC5AF|nr:PIG-L family deacetylase [Flavobacterium sp. CYK-55]MBS7786684.1 PIG-L family deacetylase [Flavobacterium sp. CYK-55]